MAMMREKIKPMRLGQMRLLPTDESLIQFFELMRAWRFIQTRVGHDVFVKEIGGGVCVQPLAQGSGEHCLFLIAEIEVPAWWRGDDRG
jgi:hypothetical protein